MPPNEDNFDAKYTNSERKDNNEEQVRQNSMLLRSACKRRVSRWMTTPRLF
jgi:hypothetical protein